MGSAQHGTPFSISSTAMKKLIWAKYIGKTGNGYQNSFCYQLDITLFPKQGLLGRIFNPVDLVVKCDGSKWHDDRAYSEKEFIKNWELKNFVD